MFASLGFWEVFVGFVGLRGMLIGQAGVEYGVVVFEIHRDEDGVCNGCGIYVVVKD
jgi:hypothetical protein